MWCAYRRDEFCASARVATLCSFFFSSRRRHTRFDCDWSSDVCSSDLPWTSCVHEREHARTHDGEQRHRLGSAIDRGTPALLQEQKNRGDQSAGVTDTDPPDEIDDRKSPAHRMRNPPNTGAFPEQVTEGEHQNVDDAEGKQ